jgi:hypothetical protein|tara:strand:- start:11224 stop:11577 length:354 start_codon:yes stop_codon:yes gene_type:complete
MINNTKNGATREEARQHLQNKGERKVVGGSGGLGFIGGAGIKAAAYVGKGAFTLIRNLLTRNTVKGSGASRGGQFNEIIGPLGKALNKTKVPKSKPVDFKGPNSAHNTGAGGNSYPR